MNAVVPQLKKQSSTQRFFFNNFQYRDVADAHNGSRIFLIVLEEMWKIDRWA